MDLVQFNFSVRSPGNGIDRVGSTIARMLPRDGESELMLLARACKEVLEYHPDAEDWQITGVEKVTSQETILAEPDAN